MPYVLAKEAGNKEKRRGRLSLQGKRCCDTYNTTRAVDPHGRRDFLGLQGAFYILEMIRQFLLHSLKLFQALFVEIFSPDNAPLNFGFQFSTNILLYQLPVFTLRPYWTRCRSTDVSNYVYSLTTTMNPEQEHRDYPGAWGIGAFPEIHRP